MSNLSKQRSNQVKNLFGNVSWAKRPGESLDEYSVFSLYLLSQEPKCNAWIKTLSPEDLMELPHGVSTAESITKAAIKWRWEIRKNDYINEVYAIARKLDDKEIVSIGTLLHDSAKKIAVMITYSLDNALARGDEIPVDKVMDFMVKLSELQVLKDDIEERRKQRVSTANVPTERLKELLTAIKTDKVIPAEVTDSADDSED